MIAWTVSTRGTIIKVRQADAGIPTSWRFDEWFDRPHVVQDKVYLNYWHAYAISVQRQAALANGTGAQQQV